MIEVLFMIGGGLLLAGMARKRSPRVELVGMDLQQAQAVCMPSRGCLLTGSSNYAEQRAAWRFGDPLPEDPRGHEAWWNNRPTTNGEAIAGRDLAEAIHRRSWEPIDEPEWSEHVPGR